MAGRWKTSLSFRDPERPKKPTTAWLQFAGKYRQENPNLKGKEVLQAASTKWKSMSPAEKGPFEAVALREKKTYDEAFKVYVDSGKQQAWQRDAEKPVKPLSGCLRFGQEVRGSEELKGKSIAEASKVVGTKWKAMTSAQKEPYEKKAAAENAAYKKAMEAYKASGKEELWRKKKGLDLFDKVKAAGEAKAKATKAVGKAKTAAKKAALATAAIKTKLKALLSKATKEEKGIAKSIKAAKDLQAKTSGSNAQAKAEKVMTQAKNEVEKNQTKLQNAKVIEERLKKAEEAQKDADKKLLAAVKAVESAKRGEVQAKAAVKARKLASKKAV